MSWSSPVRLLLVVGAAAAALPLAGCSFTPVYAGAGALASQPLLALNYAKPTSRLEQVIYQELSLRFGESDSADAPQAKVVVQTTIIDPALAATPSYADPMRVLVTATLTITRAGSEPQSITRIAAADYSAPGGQVLAANAAADEAAERAARAAAESLRLAMLAELSR